VTVLLWGAWAWVVLGPAQRRHRQQDAEVAALDQQRKAVVAGFSSAPSLVARMDSATAELRHIVAGFNGVDSLDRFVNRLTTLARDAGITQIDVDPELACMMSIPLHRRTPGVTGITLDTLRLELNATGAFGAIGTWLDRLEARADFQQWSGCEWAKGEAEGTVNFTGRAAFWVVAPTELAP
jgi:hypothetical protein